MRRLILSPMLGIVGLAIVAILASAENKMPIFEARATAPRLTPEYARLTNRNKHNNTEILFEWHEARMQQHLWKAAVRPDPKGRTRTGLLKRAPNPPGPRPVGAPLGRGDCAGCADLANNLDQDIMSFDWQYMQTQMITARKNQLNNRCVFYTGLPPSEQLTIQLALGLPVLPEGQSDLATRFACSQRLFSIWNLWPGKNEIDDQSNTDKLKRNFWEIDENQSWLYRLSKINTGQFDGRDYRTYRAHYFRVMSDAMAHSCRGSVYVMALGTDMSVYRGIWADTEYPTLKALNSQPPSPADRVTRLILVNTLRPASEQYNLIFDANLDYPRLGSKITRRDPDYLHFDLGDDHDAVSANMTDAELDAALVRRHHLMKRDSCTANIEYEKADRGDWFGRGY
ncbi:hypothetical protein V8F20_006047 [Naviculisporaceae sp. PSN 640]